MSEIKNGRSGLYGAEKSVTICLQEFEGGKFFLRHSVYTISK